MAISNPGGNLNSVPAPTKASLSTNYLDLASEAGKGWAQQYVPDLMDKEAEVFGNRTISGFLSQIGAEEPMTADQVVWSEQGRLHLSYKGHVSNATDQSSGSNNGGQFEIDTDIDGNSVDATIIDHGIRVNDTVLISDSSATAQCIVTAVANDQISVAVYDAGNSTATLANAGLALGSGSDEATILVYGSEFKKGDNYNGSTSRQANEPQFKSFQNKPIILKDYYEVSGSDVSRIGWIEVSSEGGASGYLWYLKAESDTRSRFTDYLEMSMLESVLTDASQSKVDAFLGTDGTTLTGTEGLFAAIENRGNISSGVTGVNAATDLAEFDAILAEFDKQGAIEENMLFVNRGTSLAIDDMLASMNSYGAGGTSYGVFSNDEEMALNLGFSGFRRGSYDFYKSDFRYLNDKATRGGINERDTVNAIRGVIVPAGVSTVYDQTLGTNMKRPFLHVRYRASQTDDRKMKTWVTGSVGAATAALDAMQIHFLSERCLVTQGANNFMLLK
tara:strand:- start:3972 stop:5480 length:1509 start_codon:yes stop_codon:yes gene_type:complete